MKKLINFLTLFFYILCISNVSYAKDNLVSSFDFLQDESFHKYATGNEFMSGSEPGVVMMKVNLWGAVMKPGIHHIPIKTDLIKLLSYAGGPTEKAIMEDVIIKRRTGNTQKKINIDLAQILHEENTYDLTLRPDDIIVVPNKQPLLSNDAMMIAGFAATILTAIFTGVLIDQNN